MTREEKIAALKLAAARKNRDKPLTREEKIAALRTAKAPKETKPKSRTSTLDAVVSGAGQGLTAGFDDEMYGAKRAADAAGSNAAKFIGNLFRKDESKKEYLSLKDTYTSNRDMARAYNERAQQDHPVGFGAGYVGGAVGGTFAASPLAGGAKILQGAGVLRGAAIGAGDALLHEVGNAKGDVGDRLSGASLSNVGIGAVSGGLAPIVIPGVGKLIKGGTERIINKVQGVDRASRVAGETLREVAARSPVDPIPSSAADSSRTVGQVLGSRAQKDVIDPDAASEWVNVHQQAANVSPEAAGSLSKTVLSQRRAAGNRFKGIVTKATGVDTGTPGDVLRKSRNAARAKASGEAYDELYAGPVDPVVFEQKVLPFLTDPTLAAPLKKVLERSNVLALAEKLSGTKGADTFEATAGSVRALVKALEEDLPVGQITPQALDEVQRVLGSARDAALRGANPDTHLAATLGALRKAFVGQVDAATGGRMAKALDAYRVPSAINDIEDLAAGAVSEGKLNPSELADEISRLSRVLPEGEGMAAARQGITSAFKKLISENSGTPGEMNALVKKLGGMSNDHDTFRSLENILGRDKAAPFIDDLTSSAKDFLHNKQIMSGIRAEAPSGLNPFPQGAMAAAADSPVSFSVVYSGLRAAKTGIGAFLTGRSKAAASEVGKEVAGILGAPATAENLAKIENILASNAKGLRRVSAPSADAVDLAIRRLTRDLSAANLSSAGAGSLAGSGQEQ